MNIHNKIKEIVILQLKEMQQDGYLGADIDLKNVNVESCKDSSLGDLSTNACLVLGQDINFAHKLAEYLKTDDRILKVDVSPYKFINIHLSYDMWNWMICHAITFGKDFGREFIDEGKSVNIEYVSANPTGSLHVGHARGAVFGDALANLLEFSRYDVTREYYINDMGKQINSLLRSVHRYYLKFFGIDYIKNIDNGEYRSKVLKDFAQIIYNKSRDLDNKISPLPVKEFSELYRKDLVQYIMDSIITDLRCLGIEHDNFVSESDLYNKDLIKKSIDILRKKGLVYEGVLPRPKGTLDKNWEEHTLLLFKATEFGDEEDRPLTKPNGEYTYFAPDIAYHNDKINREYDQLINVFGADHNGYIPRIKGVVKALSNDKVDFDVKTVQMVKLIKYGKNFKMSKRARNVINLTDLLEHVPANVVRFIMLTRKNNSPLEFDFDKVLEQSKDNPVFYVNYAYSRINSILDKIEFRYDVEKWQENELASSRDRDMVKKVAEFYRVVELATIHREPHRIASYLYELSSMFHSLYHAGKNDDSLSFVNNPCHTRIGMLRAIKITLENGLGILGVEPMLKM